MYQCWEKSQQLTTFFLFPCSAVQACWCLKSSDCPIFQKRRTELSLQNLPQDNHRLWENLRQTQRRKNLSILVLIFHQELSKSVSTGKQTFLFPSAGHGPEYYA